MQIRGQHRRAFFRKPESRATADAAGRAMSFMLVTRRYRERCAISRLLLERWAREVSRYERCRLPIRNRHWPGTAPSPRRHADAPRAESVGFARGAAPPPAHLRAGAYLSAEY